MAGKDGTRVTVPTGGPVKIDRFGEGSWKNVVGYRDPAGEVEKPDGQWILLELVHQDGHVEQYVNGKLLNEGTSAFPASGKLLFQSEGAAVLSRHQAISAHMTSSC